MARDTRETDEDFDRLDRTVERLQALPVEGKLTQDQKREVIQILLDEGVTLADFMFLDEKPGTWGYNPNDKGEWHYKLRQVRNDRDAPLFKALEMRRLP